MRVAPLFVMAAAAMVAVSAFAPAANAQSSSGTSLSGTRKPVLSKPVRIEIVKRSPLDAGTVVKPGSKSYLDYALPASVRYPSYGPDVYDIVPRSAALPGRWDLPGF